MQWAFRQGQEGKEQLYEARDEAAEIGTYAHELIEWHLNGETTAHKPPPNENMTMSMIARSENAYSQMLRWEKVSGYRILSWERPLVSERYKFGGTPDAAFEWSNLINMGDWKSNKGIYPDAFIQCCAYIILWDENFPETPINGSIDIVRFSKDVEISDHRIIQDHKLIELGKQYFLGLREMYDLDKTIALHF